MRKKHQNLEAKIARISLKVFVKKGFFEATVDDIARAAGIGKGTIYLYFKDKPSILVRAINDHLVYALGSVAQVEKQNLSAKQKLLKIADYFTHHITGFKTLFPMVSFENITLSGHVLKNLRKVFMGHLVAVTRIISKIIKEGIKQREFREVRPEVASILFLNVIRAVFISNLFTSRSNEDHVQLMDIYFEGLKKRR